MDEAKKEKVVQEMTKPKQRPRKSEQLKVHTEPGENSKYLTHAMKLAKLPTIDYKDPEILADRVNEYFVICAEDDAKPSVAGLALAIGTDRRRVWEWANGTDSRSDVVKKAYRILNLMIEDYMQNGKINPVSGIFIMKNNFGYTDKQEHIIKAGEHDNSLTERELLQAADILPDDYVSDSMDG